MKMQSALLPLCAALLLHVTRATSSLSASSAASEAELQSYAMRKAAKKGTMTLTRAMEVMQSMRASRRIDDRFLTMIQGHVINEHGHKKKHKHSTHSFRHKRSAAQPIPSQISAEESANGDRLSVYNGGVWGALHKINDMLLETVEKADLEEIRCDSYKRTQEQLMEEIKEDMATINVLVASAMSDKAAADGKVTEHKDAGERIESELKAFETELDTELTSLNHQLKIAEGDSNVMEKILNMTQCADNAAGAALLQGAEMLECVNTTTGMNFTKLNVTSGSLRVQFEQMKHPKVMALLRAAGIRVNEVDLGVQMQGQAHRGPQACGCSCYNDSALEVLYGADQNNNSCNMRDSKAFTFLDDCCIKPDGVKPCCSPPTLSPELSYGVQQTNVSSEISPEQKCEKCSLSGSSKCPELRERFLNIAGGVSDTVEQLKHMISSTEFRKAEGIAIMKRELAYHGEVADSENLKLARALAALTQLQESQRMKTNLLDVTLREYDEEQQKCKTALEEFANEECALTKIRGELLNMDALPNNVTDCLVSVWAAEECSLTCGGGKQVLKRTIEIETDLGYKCPALEAVQSCNEARCPLDCELSDWTGWGACSAYCDGGVMDRIRPVIQQPTAHGSPCETSDDSQDCNVQACNQNCVLHDWTEWSASCTKVCGTGRQMRYKHIKEHEFGEMGTCPEFHDHQRFQWKECNTHECQYDVNYPLICEAKLDVILALDASGSVGEAGWEAIKMAAANVVASMGTGVRVGALAFSSPASYRELEVCMGWRPKSDWPAQSDCGVKWIHHLSDDPAVVKTAIDGAQAEREGTLTNIAIQQASVEFQNHGREYAQSILAVITDGVPESKDRTKEASDKFQAAGRIVFAPVGETDLEYFQTVASYPWQNNLVPVRDFQTLASEPWIHEILPQFCPNIVQQIPDQVIHDKYYETQAR